MLHLKMSVINNNKITILDKETCFACDGRVVESIVLSYYIFCKKNKLFTFYLRLGEGNSAAPFPYSPMASKTRGPHRSD